MRKLICLMGLLVVPALGSAQFWTTTGSMATPRQAFTATLLQPSGKVLVAGGVHGSGLATAELYDRATGSWVPTGSMLQIRAQHAAVLLPGGKVLVAGGLDYGITGSALATAELYDPATGGWTATAPMKAARVEFTLTLLPNGKVLAAGGMCGMVAVSFSEVYDPVTGTWASTGTLGTPRASHTATLLLGTGQVLIAGGADEDYRYTASAEIYDQATGNWTPTAPLAQARSAHTATLLPSGKVLVAGGWNGRVVAGAEVYDPAIGAWSAAAPMPSTRMSHAATVLQNGKVLVAGGKWDAQQPGMTGALLYEPATDTWTSTGAMGQGRYGQQATLLPDGRALAVGGLWWENAPLAGAELYSAAQCP